MTSGPNIIPVDVVKDMPLVNASVRARGLTVSNESLPIELNYSYP